MNKLNLMLALGVILLATTGCSSTRGWYHLPPAEFDEIDYERPVQTVQVRNL
jgi:hypothetical protein